MCEISNRNLSITIEPNHQKPDAFHCTLFKRSAHQTHIFSTVTIPYSEGTVDVLLETPEADLTNWEFCVLGFNRENTAPLCHKTTPLSTLIHNPTVVF